MVVGSSRLLLADGDLRLRLCSGLVALIVTGSSTFGGDRSWPLVVSGCLVFVVVAFAF